MTELINGRTPEEIKAGLRACTTGKTPGYGCNAHCPYLNVPNCWLPVKADALALIEYLEAKVPRWISVEERLPKVDLRYDGYEYSTDLLVYDGSRMISAYYCHTTKLWHEVRYEDNVVDATHWTLFEPPEVKHD